MTNPQTADLPRVEAPLRYLDRMDEKPVSYICEPPPGVPRRSGTITNHLMPIYDGRPSLEGMSLDDQGFSLIEHEANVSDFYDAVEVEAVYYPQVERLLKDFLGAEKVVVFDHNVRCAPIAKRGQNHVQEPVRIAHNDYTLGSGPQRVRDLLDADEAEQRLQNRFMQINVWRPIRGPVQDVPLAVCDAQSMDPGDFVATDLKFRDRVGEVYMVAHNPSHRWFYFPKMEPNEVLLLKGYDSMDDGRARFTAHTGFDDPTIPPDGPARESIEVRTFVFFGPQSRSA